MTPERRLAKVAEQERRDRFADALAGAPDGCWDHEPCCWSALEALLPHVEQEIAAAEARGAARVREAVEAEIVKAEREDANLAVRIDDLRAALDAAEKAAVGGVAGAVSAEDGLSGRGGRGTGVGGVSERDLEIRTCSGSLLSPGRCCQGTCDRKATRAVIYGDLVEHTRCAEHADDQGVIATKPLIWSATWAPGEDA